VPDDDNVCSLNCNVSCMSVSPWIAQQHHCVVYVFVEHSILQKRILVFLLCTGTVLYGSWVFENWKSNFWMGVFFFPGFLLQLDEEEGTLELFRFFSETNHEYWPREHRSSVKLPHHYFVPQCLLLAFFLMISLVWYRKQSLDRR